MALHYIKPTTNGTTLALLHLDIEEVVVVIFSKKEALFRE
jgi:hypothetical protein